MITAPSPFKPTPYSKKIRAACSMFDFVGGKGRESNFSASSALGLRMFPQFLMTAQSKSQT